MSWWKAEEGVSAPAMHTVLPMHLGRGLVAVSPLCSRVAYRDCRLLSSFSVRWQSRGVGRDPMGDLQTWFHGPISRQESEKMLDGKGVGAFLIRLSTRIWGYTLSFNDSDRFKVGHTMPLKRSQL